MIVVLDELDSMVELGFEFVVVDTFDWRIAQHLF